MKQTFTALNIDIETQNISMFLRTCSMPVSIEPLISQ